MHITGGDALLYVLALNSGAASFLLPLCWQAAVNRWLSGHKRTLKRVVVCSLGGCIFIPYCRTIFCVELAAQVFFIVLVTCAIQPQPNVYPRVFFCYRSFVTCNKWVANVLPSPVVLSALLLTSALGRDFIWEIRNSGKCPVQEGERHVLMAPVLSSVFLINRGNMSRWKCGQHVTFNATYEMRRTQQLCKHFIDLSSCAGKP